MFNAVRFFNMKGIEFCCYHQGRCEFCLHNERERIVKSLRTLDLRNSQIKVFILIKKLAVKPQQ